MNQTDAALPFRFVADDDVPHTGGFLAVVDGSAHDVLDYLRQIGEALRFPGYYGENWNALSDCIRDLRWISEHHVILWHDALPPLRDDHLTEYIDILRDAVQVWRGRPDHRLTVVFRARDRSAVLSRFNSDSPL